ncbi:hypothetical protein L1887_52546 [Cichorium endivia]|nr:hypothetical protein L1887_52546 [Cichorium endivia]
MMHKAAYFVASGARFIATNPDTHGRGFYPACGALCAGIEKISGRQPFVVGKPSPWIIRARLTRCRPTLKKRLLWPTTCAPIFWPDSRRVWRRFWSSPASLSLMTLTQCPSVQAGFTPPSMKSTLSDTEPRLRACDKAILAHERLSIVDVNAGAQPLYNEKKTHALAVNGEIYNHQALRAEYGDRYAFQTGSDCEVILALYQEKGPEFLDDLQGMFAFALYLWSKDGEIRSYYQRDWFDYDAVKDNVTDKAELRQALEDSVKSHLMSDVPYGVLLSGGSGLLRDLRDHQEIRGPSRGRSGALRSLVATAALFCRWPGRGTGSESRTGSGEPPRHRAP